MSDWQDALMARGRFGVKLTLDAVMAAHAALGGPGAGMPVVHVVGTNGKGSTSALVAHGLRRRGRRVGLYTSPHLHRVGERIRIDGAALSDAALQPLVDAVLEVEAHTLPRALTFFEVMTLAALVGFARAGVDVIVLEAGLGGRRDATRVLPATVTLLTPIDLDHQLYLGDTLAAIAEDKAAVMEDRAPAFSAPQAPEAAAVLRRVAAAWAVPLAFVEPLGRAPIGLPGEHQRTNAALALAGARTIAPDVAPEDLDGVVWPARCERVALGRGSVVFDAAHNPHGVRALVTWLGGQPCARRVVVFGCLADKDAAAMLAELGRLAAPIWLVPPGPGAHACEEARGATRYAGADDPALGRAWADHLEGGGEIVVCGSHLLVGALRGIALGVAADPPGLTDPVERRRA